MATSIAFAVALMLAVGGCRKRPETPEAQVRRTVSALEHAVEEKDLSAAADLTSAQYSDGSGTDKQTALGMLRLQFLRHPSLHLMVRITSVRLPAPGRAEVDLYAAMASNPFGSPDELARVSADLFQFHLTLIEEERGVWRVRSARYSPARLDDFL